MKYRRMKTLEHFVPEDGFPHKKTLTCLCEPQVTSVLGVGSGIAHRRMDVHTPLPDTLPVEWLD